MMRYKIMADGIIILHFLWIIFMLAGFVLTVYGVICLYVVRRSAERWNRFFDRWVFRTIHLCGMLLVACLPLLGEYCPLTLWEYALRDRYDPQTAYTGLFIANWLEKLIYPSVHPLVIIIPTVAITLFTLIVYLLRPPQKIKNLFCTARSSELK
jgi:amino acid transporter